MSQENTHFSLGPVASGLLSFVSFARGKQSPPTAKRIMSNANNLISPLNIPVDFLLPLCGVAVMGGAVSLGLRDVEF